MAGPPLTQPPRDAARSCRSAATRATPWRSRRTRSVCSAVASRPRRAPDISSSRSSLICSFRWKTIGARWRPRSPRSRRLRSRRASPRSASPASGRLARARVSRGRGSRSTGGFTTRWSRSPTARAAPETRFAAYTPAMRDNTLKQRLYAGKAAFGVMCTFPSPPVVEMLGHLGFDWVLLDNEHGSITVDTAEACIAAAELSGIAPVVRPVGNRPEIIAPFLDRGAWGVQVPHVNTADEARAAVDAVKYAPDGHRGIFSGGRPAGYGFKGSTADYARDANRQTLVCLMLEEVVAIENLPDLVTVPGVDVYFIGSGDLSQSMGLTGQQAHPDVQDVMERGIKIITGAGRIAGRSCPDNLIPKFLGLGVQYFHSGVNRLLQQSSEAYLKTVPQAAAAAGRGR